MTRPFRLLDATTTAAVSTAIDTSSSSPPLDSDLVVILAALLCALICVLGLIVVARCAWIRRLSASSSSSSSSSTSSAPPTQSPYSAKTANKGVKKKTLRSLPKLTFSSDQKFSDCTICLAAFVDGDEIRVLLQCGHAFHVPCIDTWFGSHSSCPSCRRILVISSLPVPDKTDDNSRCERCGNVQASSSSSTSSNSGSGSVDDDGTKRIDDADADSGSNNRFLP